MDPKDCHNDNSSDKGHKATMGKIQTNGGGYVPIKLVMNAKIGISCDFPMSQNIIILLISSHLFKNEN